MSTLWHVEIDEEDWDYDRFVSAVVWAETPEEAEQIVRVAKWPDRGILPDDPPEPLIERPEWRLHVTPAPTEGVALFHWHAG